MTTPDLFTQPPPPPPARQEAERESRQRSRLRRQFIRFHTENPHVYERLRDMALALKRRGKRQGIKALFEVLRYEENLKTTGHPFKLDNNLHSLYARALMHNEPELAGYFETRQLKAVEEDD